MIFEQNALTFFPPMILGITHVFAINVFTQYIKTADYWLAYLVSGLLILIYLLLCHYESVILSDYRGMIYGIRQDNK